MISGEDLKRKLAIKPYRIVIDHLRNIRQYETPIDKMRCITQCSKLIVKSIDTFWKDTTTIDKTKLTLDAD
jgi:hypothetical protein